MSTNINAATSLQPMSLGTVTGDGSFKIKVGNTGGAQVDGLSIDASGRVTPLTLGNYANDGAASSGGVPVGALYRNGSVVMVRVA